MTELLMMILIGALGFLVFYIVKIPTPALLGPMAVIIISSYFGMNIVSFDSRILFVLQSILGVYIGSSINRDNFRQIAKLYKPAFLMLIWTFFMTFGLGSLLVYYKGIEPVTAFLSTSPAGVTEISMLAVSVGADITVVSIFQLSRLIITLLVVIPFVINKYVKNPDDKEGYFEGINKRISDAKNVFKNSKNDKEENSFNYIKTIIVGLIGSIIAESLSMPGGPLIGSIIAVAVVSIVFGINLPQISNGFKNIIMAGVGISIGASIAQNETFELREHIFFLILFVVVMFVTAYLLSRAIKKITGWDELSCILATIPAGITPVTIIAYSNDCKTFEVVIMQLTRLLIVKAVIYPIILFLV